MGTAHSFEFRLLPLPVPGFLFPGPLVLTGMSMNLGSDEMTMVVSIFAL